MRIEKVLNRYLLICNPYYRLIIKLKKKTPIPLNTSILNKIIECIPKKAHFQK